MPVMAMPLGECEAAVPLRALQREFAISEDSDDGRMIDLIERALDFVTVLRPGDRLPSEILTGAASWEPTGEHSLRARSVVESHLLAWAAQSGAAGTGIDHPIEHRLKAAVQAAAVLLGIDTAATEARIAMLMDELTYLEALRDRLLYRVEHLTHKAVQITRSRGGERMRANTTGETLGQVVRLSSLAIRDLRGRFADLDLRIEDLMGTLDRIDGQLAFIRSCRDWLHRSLRAWSPVLDRWEEAPPIMFPGIGDLLQLTYRFLAPRYMPTTEWLSSSRRNPRPPPARMIW